jgi:hypothetical protein
MPALASIPESYSAPTSSPHQEPGGQAKRKQRATVATFARTRPRSRVIIISKLPARVRKRGCSTADSVTTQGDSLRTRRPATTHGGNTQVLSLNAKKPSKEPSTENGHSRSLPLVSANSPPSHSVKEPSEATINVDAFPLPPSCTLAWSLPDLVDKPLVSPITCPEPVSSLRLSSHQSSTSSAHASPRLHDPAVSEPDVPVHATSHRKPHIVESCNSGRGRRGHVDSILVDAISKSVAEQLRLFSVAGSCHVPPSPPRQHNGHQKEQSRTSSRRKVLNRFTRDLQRHAQNVSAFGKVPIFTSTPSKSPQTFRTVSALLPYRSEFRAAGLAVTSGDQAERSPRHGKHDKLPRRLIQPIGISEPHQQFVAQVDGKQESSKVPSDRISFTRPNRGNTWRYALIDREPELLAVSSCFPCFPNKTGRTIHRQNVREQYDDGLRSYSLHRNHNQQASGIIGHHNSPPDPIPSDLTNTLRARPQPNPRGSWALPKDLLPRHSWKPRGASVPAVPSKKVINMRRRSATLQTRQAAATERVDMRQRAAHRRDRPRGLRPAINSNLSLDLIPHRSTEMDLRRFVEREYHGRLSPRNEYVGDALSHPATLGSSNYTADVSWERDVPMSRARSAPLASQEFTRQYFEPSRSHHPEGRQIGPEVGLPVSIPGRTSSMRDRRHIDTQKDNYELNDDVQDRDVLRGLHIAAAAACSEDLDGLVYSKTGVQIRRFLAELMAFESLGYAQIDEHPRQRAKRRRSQMRKLKQQVRLSRDMQMMHY